MPYATALLLRASGGRSRSLRFERGVRMNRTCCPQLSCDGKWRYLQVAPPGLLVAVVVWLLVVRTAQGHCEFIADLPAESSWASEGVCLQTR